MAHATDVILPTQPARGLPAIRSIGLGDLKYALAKGLEDFRAMPTHVIFLSLIYPIAGIAIWRATFGYDVVPLLYPLAAGFALIGPFAAIGLYELSRRRELGLDTSWKHAFDIIHSPSIWGLAALGLFLLAIFGVWLAVANGIYVANFGYRQPATLTEFADMVLATPEGHRLIMVGNVVGFLFAVLAFSLSVVSFPLLLDRNVVSELGQRCRLAIAEVGDIDAVGDGKPDTEDGQQEQSESRKPPDGWRVDDVERVLPGRIQAEFAAPAQLVEPDGCERADECEPCGQWIEQGNDVVAEGRAPDRDTGDGIDQAEKNHMRRHRPEVLQAFGQRILEIAKPDRTYRR